MMPRATSTRSPPTVRASISSAARPRMTGPFHGEGSSGGGPEFAMPGGESTPRMPLSPGLPLSFDFPCPVSSVHPMSFIHLVNFLHPPSFILPLDLLRPTQKTHRRGTVGYDAI